MVDLCSTVKKLLYVPALHEHVVDNNNYFVIKLYGYLITSNCVT